MFTDAFEDLLSGHCDFQVVRAIREGGDWRPLWSAIAGSGFLELLAPESRGGAALPLPELHPLLAALGRHAVPLPVGHSICARALVTSELPEGPITFAPALLRSEQGSITCPRVPFGACASWILAPEGDGLVLLSSAGAAAQPAGDSHLANLSWPGGDACVGVEGSARSLHAMSAALHATVLLGAMERIFGMTLAYCNERQQFGRPLGKFQAVQHQLSVMAEHIAAVSIASQAALDTPGPTPDFIPAAMAKSRASRAAPLIANTAHALHGAIGITQEFDLQILTRLLHAWRASHGAESFWDEAVGRALLACDATLAVFARTAARTTAPEAT